MELDISLALQHHRDMNDSTHWAILEMIQFTPSHRVIRLYYGIKRNGIKERHYGIRHYYLNSDGIATFHESGNL